MQYRLSELVAKFGGVLDGEDIVVSGIAPTNLAASGQITFITDAKYKKDLLNCQASAIILNSDNKDSTSLPKIISDNPYLYFSYVSNLFHPAKRLPQGVKASVKFGDNVVFGEGCSVADNVVIGNNVTLGKNSQIYPNVVLSDDVTLGDNVILYANVTIYSNVKIGHDSIIHSGVVLGADGFGYASDNNKHWHKIPQVGGVIIGNKVEIGANTTIDSGALEPTIIEDGVIIDNLVQIAHNVRIGAHSAIAGCVGIAGSTKVGKHCTLGGGSGLNGHIELCDYTVIGGATNMGRSTTTPGLYFGVYPATSYKEWAKSVVYLKNMGQMQQKIKELETKIEELVVPEMSSRT